MEIERARESVQARKTIFTIDWTGNVVAATAFGILDPVPAKLNINFHDAQCRWVSVGRMAGEQMEIQNHNQK